MSWLGDRPIVTRLVAVVAAAMTAVLLAASAVVWWRVGFALDRQLDRDLTAYASVVDAAVRAGRPPPRDTPGLSYAVYDETSRPVAGDARHRLLDPAEVALARSGEVVRVDVGSLLPPSDPALRVVARRLATPAGPRVVAVAADRRGHDEALRELLLQLALAGIAVLAAASYAGYRTARAALGPVERYRRAAEEADPEQPVALPVPRHREDELTRLGETLNHLLDRIARAHAQQQRFLADAAHELRSPLAVMRTELDWVRRRPGDAGQVAEALDSLAEQVDRLVGLSDLLLDLEEARASATPTDEVDLAAVLDRVADRSRAEAAAQGRELRCVARGDTRVQGDERWLDVAVGNLVSNALRHGRGEVRLAAVGEDDHVTVSVSDDGAGLPEEFVDRAFDRFTRADESRSTPGSGLGLSLVREIARVHHGEAHVAGSLVTMTIKRKLST